MNNSVRDTREKLGLSMAGLGDLLGVSATSISSLERNERDGTAKMATVQRALAVMGYTTVTTVVELKDSGSEPVP